MHLEPVNRHLLVEPLSEEEKKTTSGVLLPEDYQSQTPTFTSVKLISASRDISNIQLMSPGKILIVQTSMLESVEHRGTQFFLVKENYVMGVVHDE